MGTLVSMDGNSLTIADASDPPVVDTWYCARAAHHG